MQYQSNTSINIDIKFNITVSVRQIFLNRIPGYTGHFHEAVPHCVLYFYNDYRCIFSVHDDYVAMGMMTDRMDFDKTKYHEAGKHADDLNQLKVESWIKINIALDV